MSIEMSTDGVQKERQISVDPVSMKEIVECSHSGLPKPQPVNKPLPSLPRKYKFLSTSLPNSGSSSPRGVFPKTKGKDQGEKLERALPDSNSLAHQHSVALSRLVWLQEKHLQRSKSCGEGRPSGAYDELDLWLTTKNNRSHGSGAGNTPRDQSKTPDGRFNDVEMKKRGDEDFKCGALCLFLPGFGKGKPVRSRREEREEMRHVISERVSLEKFECGSWRSSGIFNNGGGSDFSSTLYFDLPLELIRTAANDATLPVSSAFVFDKDVKGVLKTRGSERKSNDCRHVRFSMSSPTTSSSPCITPRMRKARDDFNSFLEAQSA